MAAFFTTLPLALGAFFGGAVADAIGPRRKRAARSDSRLVIGNAALSLWAVTTRAARTP